MVALSDLVELAAFSAMEMSDLMRLVVAHIIAGLFGLV